MASSQKKHHDVRPPHPDSPPAMERDSIVLLLLLLLLSSLVTIAANSPDQGAILDLANSLSNPPSSWASGGGGNICGFQGIKCESGTSGRVTSIDLSGNGLTGKLPSSFSSLTALKDLHLQGNTLNGDIPSLAGFTDLTRLVLDGNAFTSVPADFLKDLPSLEYLSMEDLPLKPWSVPDDIAGCSSLHSFSAPNASISGNFPESIANLSSLKFLRLSYNNLTGELPAGLAEMVALETLQLNNQLSVKKLTGPIHVVGAMKSLRLFWIQSNKFTGPMPDFNHTQLESFNVRDNMLTGVVPTSFTAMTTLRNVSLSNNRFQGQMPEFGNGVSVDMGAGNGFCLPKPGPCDPLVNTLLEMAAGFGYPNELADSWKGNKPCEDHWLGIICALGGVDTINLHSRNLSGTISPAIAKLTSLRKLDLSDNNLTGVVPDSLTTLPALKVLDVTDNSLSGKLPNFKPSVQVMADGNRFGESYGDGGILNTVIIIGILIVVVLLVTCVFLLVYRRIKKNTNKLEHVSAKGSPDESETMQIRVVGTNGDSNQSSTFPTELCNQVSAGSTSSTNITNLYDPSEMQWSMEVLLKATNNFSEDCVLGKGGFGVVFKGNIDGKLVAVKRCDTGIMGTKGQQEFMAEIDVLRKVRHWHLVAMLGYCTHGYEKLLVYEYMAGGTLREHLRDLDRSGNTPLTWTQRMKIGLDVARGIEYLHGLAHESFIHRDLKPCNILLDQELRAKVSDFGLVKLANDEDKSMMTRVAGTFGYLAPEYASMCILQSCESSITKYSLRPEISGHLFPNGARGKVSTKVDVYAYGVILMEMISGRKVLDDSLPEDEAHLVTIFRRNMLDKEKFRKFVDPTLDLGSEAWKSLLEVSDLARHCTAREPSQRPDMCHCVNRLSSLLDHWKPTEVDDDEEEDGEISEMDLSQQLQKWRCDDFTISDSDAVNSGH